LAELPVMQPTPTPASDDDIAGVLAPPPLIFAGALAAGLALGNAAIVRKRSCDIIAGSVTALLGAALGLATVIALKRAGTQLRPDRPTTALVTSGPFRYTRNPAYVGATLVYVGVALAARSVPALTFLPIALVVLERGVVEREERYLEHRFGDTYRSYKASAPRWF
jgi:protein-S-isoprenylcysteine O-methyltransferase Ste14